MVQTSHYSRLEKPTIPLATQYYAYILHVAPIATHTHNRRKSIGKKKHRKEKKRMEKKRKEETKSDKTRKERKEQKSKKKTETR